MTVWTQNEPVGRNLLFSFQKNEENRTTTVNTLSEQFLIFIFYKFLEHFKNLKNLFPL